MAFDLLLKKGSTSQIIEVTVRDATTGQGKTGIAAASVAYSYLKRGASGPASGTCGAMTPGSWASAGWAEISAANMPGGYQFGVPDLALANTDAVTIRFKISGCIDKEVKIVLTGIDLQDATAAGISRLDTNLMSRAAVSDIAPNVWQTAVATYSGTAGSFAKLVNDNLNAAVAGVAASVWSQATRSLTDKSGFSLAATQSFNNTGQTNVVPANVTQFGGNGLVTTTAGSWTVPLVGCGSMSVDAPMQLWLYSGTRSLSDKSGFSLAATQNFNNTGQTSVVPANITQWNGNPVTQYINSGTAYPSINVYGWLGFQCGGIVNGSPVVRIDTSQVPTIVDNIWDELSSGHATTGSYGKLLTDNVDAAISSRLAATSYAAPDNASIASIKAKTDNFSFTIIGAGQTAATTLDVNVTAWNGKQTSLTSADLPAVQPTNIDGTLADYIGAGTWRAMALMPEDGSYGKLVMDNLDAKVSAIKAKTDGISTLNGFVLADTWKFAGQGVTMSGSARGTFPIVAVALVDSNAQGDIWGTATSNLTVAGSVGKLLVDDLDAKVSSRQATFTPMTAADVWGYGLRTLTDKAGFTLSPTEYTSIANKVWDTDGASHLTAGTFGKYLDAANFNAGVFQGMTEFNSGHNRFRATALEAAPAADNAVISAIRSQTDKLFFTDHGDGTFDVRSGSTGTVVVDNAAIATAVWSAGTRSLTEKAGFSLANGSISAATFTAGAIDATVAPNLDAQVSSRMASFVYVAPDNASIATIKALTDKITLTDHGDGTFDVRATAVNNVAVDSASIATAVWAADTRTLSVAVEINSNSDIAAIRAVTDAYVTPDNAGIAAIQAKTDQLVFVGGDLRTTLDGEMVNAGVDTASIATAVWSSATRSLTDKVGFALADGSIGTSTFTAGAIDPTVAPNLDALVSSRMASVTYVPPDNAGIAAIRAQTDQISFVGGDVVATLNGEVVSAGVTNTSIAAAVWSDTTRTITGGTLDSVTNVVNPVTTTQAAAVASIKAATDKITFVTHGDGTWDVRAPVVAAITAADVWSYGPRTLTDKSGFALANGSVTSATFGPGAINSLVAPNLDVAVSSRMASFVYVPPDNASVAAIKTQTDKLQFLPHGDGTYDLQSNAVAIIDAGLIADAVWANSVRSLTTQVTDWNDMERGQIRKALGLSGTTAETSGEGLLDDVHHVSVKLQFNSESDVIASLAGETVFLNPMQNFNNIGQADELPAKDAILRQLLTPERADRLDHLDVPVSTRSSHSPTDVWSFSERTLTSFGTLVADMAAAVWSYGTRTLTSFGSLVADIWGTAVRTITGGIVDLSTQAKVDVRSEADAALTDFDPLTYSDAAFDRDQIIDQVEAVLAAVNVKPDASAIASAVDILLSAKHGEGSWFDTTKGSGPITYTVTVTDGSYPIAFASVRLSVGPMGISQTTDAQGKAIFDVQPGTYRVQIAKLGYTGHSTTVEIHSEPAEQSFPGVITPLAAISLPPEPGQCTAYLTTYDAVGNVQSGVEIEVRLVSSPAGSIAESFSAKPWTVASDAQGLVQVTLLKNAAYQGRRGSGEWHLLKTDQRDSVPMPTVLSHPSK